MTRKKSVLENIRKYRAEMFSAEKKVADYVLKHPHDAVNTNISELAQASGVSDATVIRMCKRMGYQGYYQMKINLSHDLGRAQRDVAEKKEKQPDTVNDLFDLFAENLKDVANNLNAVELLKCAKLIRECRMVHLVAAGNTAPIAIDLGFRLARLGVAGTYSMVPEHFLNQINLADKEDCVVVISRSGSSKQVLQAANLAKKKGLNIIAISEYRQSPLSQVANYLILTKYKRDIFDNIGPESHLHEMAINDALLFFIKKLNDQNNDINEVELLLSEFKL